MKLIASVILLLVGVLNIAASCVDMHAHGLNNLNWEEEEYKFSSTFEQTINFENRAAFELKNPAGHIQIEGWDQPSVEITATISTKTERALNDIEIKVIEASDKATVRAIKNTNRDLSWRVDFVVKVPLDIALDVDQGAGKIDISSYSGGLTVDLGAGQVNLEDIFSPELKVDLGAGETNITTFEGQVVRVDIGAGQLNFQPQSSQMFHLIDVDVSTGEINLLGIEAQKLNADVGMGQINLHLYPGGSYTIDADAGIGNISIHDFENMSMRQEGFIGQNVHVVMGNGEGDIDLDVGTGEIQVMPWSTSP